MIVEEILAQGHILDRLRCLGDFPASNAVDEKNRMGTLSFPDSHSGFYRRRHCVAI